MNRAICCLCLMLATTECAFAQSDSLSNIREFSLHEHVGRLVKIHGEYPVNKISTLTEFHVGWKLNGAKKWHSAYRFPTAGVSLIHAQFGNQDVLGQALAVIPSMRFERWTNKTRWSWRAGLGIAGFNKPYDAESNPKNLVIGSRFTNMTMFRFEMSRPLSDKFRYAIGFSFTHCSDAHIAVPNIGANLISLHAGLSFCNHPSMLSNQNRKQIKQKIHDIWKPGAEFIFGIHEFQGTTRPIDGPRYFIYGESVFLTHQFVTSRTFSIGVNHYYYTSFLDYMTSQELFPAGTNLRSKAHQLALFTGYEWHYGRISLFVQAGLSLYNPFLEAMNKVWDLPKHGSLYLHTSNKIGYRIHFIKASEQNKSAINPYFQLAVKTNGGTADFLEFALGTSFGRSIPKRSQWIPK